MGPRIILQKACGARKIRMEILREFLRFFSEKNAFYDKLFRRLGLDRAQLIRRA